MIMKAHRPLFIVFILLCTGIIASYHIGWSYWIWCSCFLVMMSVYCAAKLPRLVAAVILCLSIIFLGGLHTRNTMTLDANHVYKNNRSYWQKIVGVEGVVSSEIQHAPVLRTTKTTFLLDVKRIDAGQGWRAKTGRIKVDIFKPIELNYGDYIFVKGKLHKPYNFSSDRNFNYPRYLRHKGIYLILSVKKDASIEVLSSHSGWWVKEKSIQLKNALKNVFDSYLTANESALMQAVILGERAKIPKHIRELFVRTGTAHILAISGLHIGIVTALIFLLLKLLPISRRQQLLVTILLLIFYAFLTGGRPSVVRATIMAVVLLGSFIVERETDGVNSLAFAGLLILLWNPLNIFDIGFQLSFLSVLSILYLCPKFVYLCQHQKWLKRNRLGEWIAQSFSVSLAAWIGVSGLIAYYFQIMTPVSIIANLFVVPLIGAIVATGFCLLISGMMIPFLAGYSAACVKLSLNLMAMVVYVFDQIPGSSFYVSDVSYWHTVTYYIFVCAIFCLFHHLIIHFFKNKKFKSNEH